MPSMTGRPSIVFALLLAVALATVIARREAERRTADVVVPNITLDLPLTYARLIALEHDSAVADLLWIRFVHKIPFKPADETLGYELAQQLESVVALDPAFRSAYVQGTILLSVLGNQPCASVRIAERGIERFPGDWRIPFQAGYNCFAEVGDPECASRHMSLAASLPGAPPWLPALVARLLADANQDDAAIDYLRLQLERTTDERLRERFEERLRDAVLARDLSRIEAAARRHRAERGAEAASVEALVAGGFLDAIPNDPFGGRYELVPGARARSTSGRTGLRTFARQAAFVGEFSERLFQERLAARLFATFEGAPFVRLTSLDALERKEVGEATVKAIVAVLPHTDDERRLDYQVLQARAFLRRDVDELREAQLDLLREGAPAGSDDLDAIRARAGVPTTDPFGTPYQMLDGLPSAGPSRNPLTAVASSLGGDRCR